jgi:hypothetical protein
MASEKAVLGGNLLTGRHKDICEVLEKWREAAGFLGVGGDRFRA